MAKKFFFALLIVLLLMVVFVIYEKTNPTANKMFKISSNGINQTNGSEVQPTSVPDRIAVGENGVFVDVTEPANNTTVGNATVTLSGKTVTNGNVSVNDQDLKADSHGNFSTTVILQEGQNDIYVVASDDLGNSAEKDITVNLESTQ